MAFKPLRNAARQDDSDRNSNWKANGFLNFYMPTASGGRAKVGAIALKEGKPNDRKLLEWLGEDPDRAEQLLKSLTIEFRSTEHTEENSVVLPT